MVYCSNCGKELPDWARFCERCGTPLQPVATESDEVAEEASGSDEAAEEASDELTSQQREDAGEQGPDVEANPDDEAEAQDLSEDGLFDIAAFMAREAMAVETTDDSLEELREAEEAFDGVRFDSGVQHAAAVADDEAMGDQESDGGSSPDDDAWDGEPSDEEVSAGRQDEDAPEVEDGLEDDVQPDADADGEAEADDEEASEDDAEADADDAEEQADSATSEADEELQGDGVHQNEPAPFVSPFDTIGGSGEEGWNGGMQSYRYAREQRVYDRGVLNPMKVLRAVLVVALAIGVGLGGARMIIRLGEMRAAEEEEATPSVVSKAASRRAANKVIMSLDGWWKTERTFDNRAWYLKGGHMKVYAADGKVAKEIDIDPESVERMTGGPGGIEGAGYYLRDIAFYLRDDEPDTLYSISQDGTPEGEANLHRSDPPDYVNDDGSIKSQEEMKAEEEKRQAEKERKERETYILAESNTRTYTHDEVAALSDYNLLLARYEIYARHGYRFNAYDDLTTKVADYFNSRSWYTPSDTFSEWEINSIEWSNWNLIQQVEQERGSQYAWTYV